MLTQDFNALVRNLSVWKGFKTFSLVKWSSHSKFYTCSTFIFFK